MAVPILIPKLGVAVTSATVTEWLVADGDRVEEGQPLYTLATDKAETEIEAPASGVVSIECEVDVEYAVGTMIGEIG